jgi:hypothetical protein
VSSGVAGGQRKPALPSVRQGLSAAGTGRYLLASLLILLVVFGMRAATPAVTWQGPLKNYGFEIGAGAEAILAILLLVLRYVSRRNRQPGHPAATIRIALRRTIGVSMACIVGLALAGVIGLPYEHLKVNPLQINRGFTGKYLLPPKKGDNVGASFINAQAVVYIGIGLAVIVVLAGVASLIAVRRRQRRRWTGRDAGLLFEDFAGDLLDAVESARYALQAVDDARAAIISCYVAMENSLARAGTARLEAETPGELLARAERAGLLHGPAAGRLTRLFYEARFSTHQVAGSARADALQALDEISADLRGSAADVTAAVPGEPA